MRSGAHLTMLNKSLQQFRSYVWKPAAYDGGFSVSKTRWYLVGAQLRKFFV
jgi:hypothetical protein